MHDAAGNQLGGRLIIVGGGGGSELSAVESTTGDRRPWRIQGHLPSPRSDLSVAATSHGLMVIGGYDGLSSTREVLVSDNGRSFSTFAHLRRGVRYAAVILVGDSAWVFGGEDQGRELRTTQVIDLKTRQVLLGHQLPTPLGHAAVALVAARILLMGGRTGPHHVTAKVWWFDPAAADTPQPGSFRIRLLMRALAALCCTACICWAASLPHSLTGYFLLTVYHLLLVVTSTPSR